MCSTKEINFIAKVDNFLKENGFEILGVINGNVLTLKFSIKTLITAIDKGVIERNPHPQRHPNWNKKQCEIMFKTTILPIYNDSYSVSAIPDIMFAMCFEYKYLEDTGMYKLCLTDGGHRVRVWCNFCKVEPFVYKKTIFDPSFEVRVDGVIKQLYFKETEYTRKKQLEFGNIIYLSPEKQEMLLNMDITGKISYQVYTFIEMNTLFNGYQNQRPISKNSSEFLKNVNCPLMISCSMNTVFDIMRDLTLNYPNCPEFFAHNTVIFYLLYSKVKHNSGNAILDIISADDKVYAKKVRTYEDDHGTDLSGTPEEFNGFNEFINTYYQIITIFPKNQKKSKKMSFILFKSLFLILLKSNNHSDLLKKIKMNIENIESFNENINPIWFNKQNKETKISYSANDVRDAFEECIAFLESLLLKVKLTIRVPTKESENIVIKKTDIADDILSEITTKSDHSSSALYLKERPIVGKRDFKGRDKILCLCCNEREITKFSKQCGHIVSRNHGGPDIRDNMICICKKCNGNSEDGMGTENLFVFQERRFPLAPSARLYMDNIIKNGKYNIINFKLNQLKELAKKNGISSTGVKQDIYNRVQHLLHLLV